MRSPVQASQRLILFSADPEKKRSPSQLNLTMVTGLQWPLRTRGRMVLMRLKLIQISMLSNKQDTAEQDVRANKIKQGYLSKRSRLTKEWKKVWIVLTRSYLYSFEQQGLYKHPTEKIALKDISTIKSFYKHQYDRAQVFRVESDDNYFYLSAHDHQEKWAWVTSLEKITEMIRNPVLKETMNLIRESLKMATAIRSSTRNRASKTHPSEDYQNDVLKRLKLRLHSHLNETQLLPTQVKDSPLKLCNIMQISIAPQKQIKDAFSSCPVLPELGQKIIERVVEKIIEVEVPVDRIVERTVEVEKIVYVDAPVPVEHCSLIDLFSSLIASRMEDPRPILDFVAFLTLTGVEKYQNAALEFCCQENMQRFFAELLLQAVNQEMSEDRLNNYFGFIYVLCERQADYFYASDLRILVDIVLRQLQLYRSDLNQMINLRVLKVILSYHLNILEHKRCDIGLIVEEMSKLGPQQNQEIASEVLFLIS